MLQEKGNKEKIKLQCKDTPSFCVTEEAVRERSLGIRLYRKLVSRGLATFSDIYVKRREVNRRLSNTCDPLSYTKYIVAFYFLLETKGKSQQLLEITSYFNCEQIARIILF